MTIYFLDRYTLEIKDVIVASKFDLKFDEETNATSNIELHRIPNANQNDFIVAKKKNKTKYQGIVSEIQGEKDSNQAKVICKDISNLFDRKIYVDSEECMDTSLEDFLYYTINKFFKNGDDDSKIAMPYLSVVQDTQTSVKEPINAEDGIYNFHTFMTNCRQNKNISVVFELTQQEIVVTIKNIDNQNVIKIDTTNNDVINYNKIYEMDITSRVTVKCGDTGNILNYYLLTDRTISTDKTNPNRADGMLETIYVDEEGKAYEQAVNIFKGNRYNHLVEFEIKQDSKLVNTGELTIGRPIQIKTRDGILDSYISSIEIENTSNYIKYKSGNIRVDLIDKLKQEPYKIGVNKVDKASVKSSTASGEDKTYSCDYINSKLEKTFAQMWTNVSGTTYYAGPGVYKTIDRWHDYVQDGGVKCDPAEGYIKIPAGTCKRIKVGGQVCGSGYGWIQIFIQDSQNNKDTICQNLIQSSGNGYWANSMPNAIVEIDDSQDNYLYMRISGYNGQTFYLNNGFGAEATFMNVEKID